jgi:uridylate kinase
MTTDRIAALNTLLAETEAAHRVFETTELNGVYDQDWPRWYAAYAVEHGIATLVGHALTTDELAEFLATSWGEFEHAQPKPGDPWAAYTARRIAAEL